jgi:predicted transcriptional regulator
MTNQAFQTMAEVDEYLSGDTVECLICCKNFQCLPNHILRKHDTVPEEYHRRFGIPFSRSLTSAKYRAMAAAAVSPQSKEGLRREGAARTGPPRFGGHRIGIPAVENKNKEIQGKDGWRAHLEPATVACANCGAEVTNVIHACGPVRCLQCLSPGGRQSRITRSKNKTVPPPLTPAELAAFDKPFETMEQVDAYLSGETIACLICGQHKLSLPLHLYNAHNITPEQYRGRFGIPSKRGLLAAPVRAAHAAIDNREYLERFRLTGIVPRRGPKQAPTVPCIRNMRAQLYIPKRTVACAKCGVPVETPALIAHRPIDCIDCAPKGSRYSRLRRLREKEKKAA